MDWSIVLRNQDFERLKEDKEIAEFVEYSTILQNEKYTVINYSGKYMFHLFGKVENFIHQVPYINYTLDEELENSVREDNISWSEENEQYCDMFDLVEVRFKFHESLKGVL